jgi:hypothetical protein
LLDQIKEYKKDSSTTIVIEVVIVCMDVTLLGKFPMERKLLDLKRGAEAEPVQDIVVKGAGVIWLLVVLKEEHILEKLSVWKVENILLALYTIYVWALEEMAQVIVGQPVVTVLEDVQHMQTDLDLLTFVPQADRADIIFIVLVVVT